MLHKNEEAGRTVPSDLGHLFPEEAPSDTEPDITEANNNRFPSPEARQG